ncbi:MAG: cytochrome c biogenesis protein CcdA [Kiritimatiellales bacterium]|jgi:thiol:disulfide interchange protein
MKKLILFSLLLAAALTGAAQTNNTFWAESLQQFEVSYTGSGYMGPSDFNAFLDRAEGGRPAQSFYARFSDDPVVFLRQWGLWRTLFLILLGGLALNLTPCVLPMIPVNLAIIGAGVQSESRRKGFSLGAVYGLGITVVYGILGLAVVLGGARFGALNASPWFNSGIAAVFLILSLSMFGVLHIDLSRFQSGLGGTQFKSRFAAAFVMGGVAALLAGACVAPVVIAVLLLSGNLYTHGVQAGLVLPFVLGLGMALPWPFAGAGLSFLPKPGAWMEWVKRGFGILILLFAVYYGLLAARLLRTHAAPPAGGEQLVDSAGFRGALDEAHAAGRPVFIDFWADWCKNCHAMDTATLANPEIKKRLARYRVIKFDASKYDESPAKEILDRFGVVGLPAYVILSPLQQGDSAVRRNEKK